MSCTNTVCDTREIALGPIKAGTTKRIEFTLTRDGEVWTGVDSVVFRFTSPEGDTTFDRDATLEEPDAGVWYYETTVLDFTETGLWIIEVLITDDPIYDEYPYQITLEVV